MLFATLYLGLINDFRSAMESESPPASPSELIVGAGEDSSNLTFRWDCGGRSTSLNTDNRSDTCYKKKESDICGITRIFSIVTLSRTDTDHLEELLQGFCQHLAILRLSSERDARSAAAEEISLCVHHLKFVARRRVAEGLDCGPVLDAVREMVTQLDTVTQLDMMTQELLHCWLEARCGVTEICVMVPDNQHPPDTIVTAPALTPGTSWAHQLLAATILDLLHLASIRFSSLDISHKNITQMSIFQCPCVEEVWISLFNLCILKDINIWSVLEGCNINCENHMDVDEDADPSLLQYSLKQYPESMWLMFLTSLVSLMASVKELQESSSVLTNFQNYLKRSTKKFLSNTDQRPSEAKLRTFLKMLLHVTSKIGPSLDILSETWKFFSQTTSMNSSCRLKTMTLEGSTSIPATTTAWLETVLNISAAADPSSFTMFAQLCSRAVGVWTNNTASDSGGAVAREVKVLLGRISVKINPAKLAQLNEYGVFHLATLLLCISAQAPGDLTPQQIAVQMLKASHEVSPEVNATSSTFQTIVKSCLTLCQLSVHRGVPLNSCGLADQVATTMDTLVTRLKAAQSNIHLKRVCQDLVKIHNEAVAEIADTSVSLSTDEECLAAPPWVAAYLGICSVTEMSSILSTASTLLTRARMTLATCQGAAVPTTEQLGDTAKLGLVVARLWAGLYPAVRQLATCLTAPPAVATIAADFIIQRAESADRGEPGPGAGTPEEMVRFFTQNKAVPVEVAASILFSLCHNSAVTSQVSASTLLTSAALASLAAPPGSEAHQHVRGAWQRVAGEPVADQADVALVAVQQAACREAGPGLVAAMAALCGDPAAWRGEAAVVRQYQVAGWLVHAVSQVSYSHNFSNPLATIINNLLTPNEAFNPNWNLSLTNKRAIRQSLPYFLKGIVMHPNFDTDKFLQRKFSEIVRIYLPRYDTASKHPLVSLVGVPGLVTDPQLGLRVCGLAVEVVARLAADNVPAHPRVVASCMKYIEAGLLAPQHHLADVIIDKALLTMLDIVSRVEDKNVKNPIVAIFKSLLLKAEMNGGMLSRYSEKLSSFVKLNIAFNAVRLFNSLRVIGVINKNVILGILPQLSIAIENVEKKRGSGKDAKLRKALSDLHSIVQ